MNWKDIDYDWVNNEIDEVKQKDIKSCFIKKFYSLVVSYITKYFCSH